MAYQIREGGKEDVDRLVDLIREAFQEVADRFGLTEQNSPTHPSNCRTEWLMREMNRGVVFYVLEAQGRPVGCVALEKINDEVCYLERLAVLPREQKKGFGEALVRHALSEARLLKAFRVQIGVIADDSALQNWYEKLGFEEVERKNFPHQMFEVAFMAYYFL